MADALQGLMTFAVDTGEKPATYPGRDVPPDKRHTGKFEDRTIAINSGRPLKLKGELDLDQQGFLLTDHATACTDFFDEGVLESVYYPECIELVKKHTGVAKVAIFDHTLRVQDPDKREAMGTAGPVLMCHNDYTDWSGPKRLRDILPADEAEERLKHRYVMVNVWRPIMEPVRSNPLGLCDARTMSPEDLVAADHIFADRKGETYRIAYNDKQDWYYFPEMNMSEAVLIKCYDSMTDGRARFSGHGAITHPFPEGTAPRESIEVRTIGFFDD